MNTHRASGLVIATAILLSGFTIAAPSITDVTARQRYPWNGKVDISYTISGDATASVPDGMTASLKVMATDSLSNTNYAAKSLSGDVALTDGTHNIVWDMETDGLALVSTAVVFTVSCEAVPALYCVIDLSAGANASSYPVANLAEPPPGGFNSDAYKTMKLVLRRIDPGSFMMCGRCQTTLTKPYYVGVFEVTQKQYELIMGNNPSESKGDKRPVEHVFYNSIRGSAEGAEWPSSSAVDPASFMGKLRARTGLNFDLPTEAQWEYACRAGTTSSYNNGGNAESDLRLLGRYSGNRSEGLGGYTNAHTTVGSYQPNAWGLYDMHGNVNESCLDWYDNLPSSPQTDPKGPTSCPLPDDRKARVARGGCYYSAADACKVSLVTSREFMRPSGSMAGGSVGFRLARPLSVTTLCSGESVSAAIDLTTGTRMAKLTETIRYSAAWETNETDGVTAVVAVNGEAISSAPGSGDAEWRPTHNGAYTLTHRALLNGMQIGDTLTATFEMSLGPDTPVISPADGTIFGSSLSVSISCATEGATIHYTTDGTEPTLESPIYRRFRVSGRTVVKAVAIKDGLSSEVSVAEYAPGRCANPVISPADGTTFEHAGQQVSIAWSGADGILRYTTNGSDPTTNSPVYGGPFTIDDSTIVKAKAFGSQYFDSAIVTARLTRIWVNVATPVVNAPATFTRATISTAIITLYCATEGATIRYTLDGTEPGASSAIYTEPFYVTDSCTVKAYAVCEDYLDSAVATHTITKVWGIGDTLGAPDQVFASGGDLPFVRVTDNTATLGESMKSGAITHEQTSTLSTTVIGPGTISFQWKASCEDSGGEYDWDHAEFWVDDTRIAQLDGETDWQTFTQAISGGGSHTLLWKYVKDNEVSEGEDCCWVADYNWVSANTETQTTPAPVPYVWLRTYYPGTPDEHDFYEAAAKETAANGVNKVWECYVAGLVPTNVTDVFRTVISMEGGKPQISWEPRLNAAEEAKRVYTIYGRERLDAGGWTTPTNAASRFFRVKVNMVSGKEGETE